MIVEDRPGNVILSLAALLMVAGGCGQPEARIRATLENSAVSLAFDKRTGALVSLRNLATGDECLKKPGGAGNPFRLYVDTTELPWFMRSDHVGREPGALGGKLVDPANCTLIRSSSERVGGAGVLRLVYRHAEPDLTCELEVRLPDDDVAATFALTVRNSGEAAHHLMAASPYLSGLGLGSDPETNLAVRLLGFGQSRGKAWANAGGVYGWQWGGQWNAVYEKSLNEGLGLIVQDTTMRDKALCRHPGGIMNVFYFDNQPLKPGESVEYPAAQVIVHRGNWKVVARRYGRWFRSAFPLRRQPRWFDEVDMFLGTWIPHPRDVARHKRNPDNAGVLASFEQLPRLYLNGHNDLQEWAQYWQGVIRHDIYHSYNHTDGVYDVRHDLGGAAGFRTGVVNVEKIGRFVGLYIASRSVRTDSIFFAEPYPGAGTKPEDWFMMYRPKARLAKPTTRGDQTVHMCVRYPPWQDHLAATIKRLLRETGARYVRIDEFGHTFLPCWNPAHKHESPFRAMPEVMEFLRKIRAAIDEVDSDIVLFTEGATDMLALYCDGTLNLWVPGPDIAPMRLTVPNYIGLSYHLGQVDCALNGFVPGTDYACNRYGWWNSHHGKLWSPGLEHKPKNYPKPEGDGYLPWPGGKLRWHELGASFVQAVRHGDPTDINPVGIDQDPEEWASRLWRAREYWLLVCGSRAAYGSETPVRVRLPELPESVRHAFEFDVETLAMRDATLERTNDGIFVTVVAGFSAVLLPKPDCPPVVETSVLPILKPGEASRVKLTAFAPWRASTGDSKVTVAVPGLTVSPREATLPAMVTLKAPRDAESGAYKLLVKGNSLPLKRWLTYKGK